MTVFGIKKKYKITFLIIISIFYLVAIGFLIYEALSGIRNFTSYFLLIILTMATPVLLTILAIGSFSSYFVFYNTYFEFHRWNKVIRIEAKNLRYFYFHENIFTIYFVKNDIQDFAASFYKEKLIPENSKERQLALPEDKEIYKLLIGMSGIQGAEQILEWFYENLPCIPDDQALKDIEGIINKYNEPDPRDVNIILAKANKIASIVNWISVIAAVWCFLFPYPYHFIIGINILIPFVLLFILHFSDGWIHFDKKGNSIYPTVCLAGICPAFGLGLRLIDNYIFVNSTGRFMITSAIFYFIYLILFIIFQKEYSFKEKYTYGALILYSFFFFSFAMGVVAAVNCVFDFSVPVEKMILKNGEMVSVLLHKGLLGIKWYYNIY